VYDPYKEKLKKYVVLKQLPLESELAWERREAALILALFAKNWIVDESVLPKLVKLLDSKSKEVYTSALYALACYARRGFLDTSALPKLVKLLEKEGENKLVRDVGGFGERLLHKDEGTLRRIAQFVGGSALLEFTDMDALPTLISKLKELEKDVKQLESELGVSTEAVDGLIDSAEGYLVADISALPKLVKLLDHRDEDVRGVAAYALGVYAHEYFKLADASALPKLVKLLDDRGKRGACGSAAYALAFYARCGLVDESALPKLVELLGELELLRELEQEDRLIEVMFAVEEYARKGLVGESALPRLVKLLDSEIGDVRSKAVQVLGVYADRGLADGAVLPKLVKLLDDKDAFMDAVFAVGSYARCGFVDESAFQRLVELSGSKYEDVREGASRALDAYVEMGFTSKSVVADENKNR